MVPQEKPLAVDSGSELIFAAINKVTISVVSSSFSWKLLSSMRTSLMNCRDFGHGHVQLFTQTALVPSIHRFLINTDLE